MLNECVQIMAELALKVRLLDVTGDGVEIPEKITHGPGTYPFASTNIQRVMLTVETAPRSVDFWFAK
jgi:engulfment/cell motility protein 1